MISFNRFKISEKPYLFLLLLFTFLGCVLPSFAADSVFYNLKAAEYCPEEVRDLYLKNLPKDKFSLDISQFSNLKNLEIKDSPIQSLTTLGNVPPKIESISILRCISFEPEQLLEKISQDTNARRTFSHLSLSGSSMLSIPSSVGMLDSLQFLDLSKNSLKLLPESLSNLKRLERLNISSNELKTLPLSFGLLPLKELQFSFNRKELKQDGILRLSSLAFITNLELRGWKELPVELSQLTTLESLNLSNGSFESIPKDFKSLNLLTNLNLANCRNLSSKDLLNSFELENLEELSLGYYGLFELPNALSNAKKLESIYLNRGQLNTSIPSFASLQNLQKVDFRNVRFDAGAFSKLEIALSQIGSLNDVDFISCQLNQFPARLLTNKSIQNLRLNGNQIKTIPQSSLQELKDLATLNLMNNPIDFKQIDALKMVVDYDVIFNTNRTKSEVLDKEKIRFLQRIGTPIAERIEDVQPETYEVDVKTPQTLTVNSGTTFEIPRMAFLDMAGNIVTGPVDIKYVEYQDPLSIIANNVDMTYTEDGLAENFVSAGMFSFEAFNNGKPLIPNPKNPIKVNFLSDSMSSAFNLYYYDTTGTGWKNISTNSNLNISEQEKRKTKRAPTAVNSFTNDSVAPVLIPNNTRLASANTDQSGYLPQPVAPKFFQDQYGITVERFSSDRKMHLVFKSKKGLDHIRIADNEYWDRISGNTINMLNNARFTVEDKNARYLKNVLASLGKAEGNHFDHYSHRIRKRRYTVFSELELEPNEKSDNFKLKIKIGSKIIEINVFPLFRGKSQTYTQRNTKRFFDRFKKVQTQQKGASEAVKTKYANHVQRYDLEMKSYRAIMVELNKERLEVLNNEEAAPFNMQYSFTLLGFGRFNCDRTRSISSKVRKSMAQAFVDSSGKKQYPNRTLLIDVTENATVIFYEHYPVIYASNKSNALITYFNNGRLGYVSQKAFADYLRKKESGAEKVLPVVTLLDKDKHLTVKELQALILK